MKRTSLKWRAAMAIAAALAAPAGARADTIVDDWSKVQAPPAVELKDVKLDPRTTAYLVLDIVKQTCNTERRPRCLTTVPKIAKLLDEARSHKMPVIYSVIPNSAAADILPAVAPKGDEPVVMTVANKFIRTDLDKILKEREITQVVIAGTAAEGAVLFTASEAAFLGYKVIVLLDGASAVLPYAEQAMAWTLANAPGVGASTTLTSFDRLSG
jgi:nicotinamidase-related amidase